MRIKGMLTTVLLAAAVAVPAGAGQWKFEKEVPFELGKWVEVSAEDGPVKLHRIRVVEYQGRVGKAEFFRPFSSEYMKTVQVQLEYSNSATKDWKARIYIEWLDADGTVIDGYNDEENLDDSENHDVATVTQATLKYGLDRAKKFKIRLDIHPD